jgi:hypothetical protein
MNRMHRHAAIAAQFLRLVLHADPATARRTLRIHTLHSLARQMLHHPSRFLSCECEYRLRETATANYAVRLRDCAGIFGLQCVYERDCVRLQRECQ